MILYQANNITVILDGKSSDGRQYRGYYNDQVCFWAQQVGKFCHYIIKKDKNYFNFTLHDITFQSKPQYIHNTPIM